MSCFACMHSAGTGDLSSGAEILESVGMVSLQLAKVSLEDMILLLDAVSTCPTSCQQVSPASQTDYHSPPTLSISVIAVEKIVAGSTEG